MNHTASRVLLLGLDGAAFDILSVVGAEGVLPVFTGMLERARVATLRSTVHPLSPPAWASIMTGRSPGSHGIFDFVRIDHTADHPAYSLISATDLEGDSIFTLASRAGCRVTALNFPCMFPPPALTGAVVPGYVPWSYLSRACQPRELFSRLRHEAGLDPRRLAVDWEVERTAVQGLPASELTRWVELHIDREEQWAAILDYLMRTDPADLTAIVFDGVDRIQHLALHLLLSDPSDLTAEDMRTRTTCLRYFRMLDRVIGRAVDRAGPEVAVVIVSDHGAQLAGDRIFYANTWLAENGHLRWANGVSVDGDGRLALNGNTESTTLFDWDHTCAAALTSSSNGIVVHRSAFPNSPGVRPEGHRRYCRRLADELLAATDPATGERLVARVLLRDEAFPGPENDSAPDLTLELASPGFLSVLRGPAVVGPRLTPYGTHHPNGIFVATGAGIDGPGRLGSLSVIDVAPTVLQLLGVPIPEDVEGRVAVEAMTPAAADRAPRRPLRDLVPTGVATADSGLDAEGEAEIMSRLRLLGYVE